MSRVIKPHLYVPIDDRKLIDVASVPVTAVKHTESPEGRMSEQGRKELEQVHEMKEQILRDAESAAEAELRAAMDEASAMKEQALQEVEEWWNERRSLDDQIAEESRHMGYETGIREGIANAEEAVRKQYAEMMAEAKTVLEQAYQMKEQIIRESEPFLIELASAVAEKIIHHELTVSPEISIAMTRSVLSRSREKGNVTLCVAPEHFAYIRDAREELMLAVGSQAELQIVPDSTVSGYGCVVRSAFGSMDARVDTQLKEIKNALQQLALRDEGDDGE